VSAEGEWWESRKQSVGIGVEWWVSERSGGHWSQVVGIRDEWWASELSVSQWCSLDPSNTTIFTVEYGSS